MTLNNKIYVLDTNVLIHDPQAIYAFSNSTVAIPIIVLEELDRFKSENTDRGRNAREASRQLDSLRHKGSLKDGVFLDNGGLLKIVFDQSVQIAPFPFLMNEGDNQILLTALNLMTQGKEVTFISKDINARVKADVLGIKTEDYLKGRVAEYDIYKGWRRVSVPSIQIKKDFPDVLNDLVSDKVLELNEFVLIESNNNPFNYNVYRYLGGNHFKHCVAPHLRWPIQPRNAQQLMTLDLLFDPKIQFVSLVGPAGTGKTFLALVAGMQQVMIQNIYEKILISRPVIPLGPDIGYLPGDVQEKLRSWMQPIYDNLELIVHSSAAKAHFDNVKNEDMGKKYKKQARPEKEKERERREFKPLQDIINSGKISLEAITYMRGRSIPYQYIFIDEVQNLSPHEVKTLVTRVGQGSKIIMSGDPYQIDSPYLDFSSNGLVVASNKFKGQNIFGTVFLETSERSELSRLAAELL